MLKIDFITFGPFQENTYILHDETKQCVIIDPGCYSNQEKKELRDFIETKELKPVKIWLTHGHIDHILGNAYLARLYDISIQMHKGDVEMMRAAPIYGQQWGIQADASPEPERLLTEGETISFGNTSFSILFTPGHSPGSICFYHTESRTVIGGDVLFRDSIGRTDLPGGDFSILENSIRTKLYTLPDNTVVYPGHGPETTIGWEKMHNSFVRLS